MFAALIIRPQSNKFLKRKFQNIFPKKTEVLQTAVRNGAPFFTVIVSRKKGEIPWEDIEFYVGNCAERMLLPEGVLSPENSRIKVFEPQVLPKRVLFNTACELFSRSKRNPVGRTITLIDENGAMVHEVYRLVPFASAVRVVTQKGELYDRVSQEIMERFGATILIADSVSGAADSNFIIAPEGIPDSFLPSGKCAVISGREQPSRGFISVTCKNMNLQEHYRRVVPRGIDSDIFAAALFEKCGVASLAGLTYTRLHLFGADTTLCGAAKMLDSLDQT